jgi:hypothetical protein
MSRSILTAGLFLLGAPALLSAAVAPKVDTDQAVVVPFELLKTKHMSVMIKVNGKGPYRVIFDTGAPVNILNNKIAREAALLKKSDMPLFTLFGSNGPVTVRTLEVGAQKAANVPAVIMDHPALEAAARVLGPIEGIVGFPFFARYRLTLDYRAKTMTLIPNGYDPPDVLEALMAAFMGRSQEQVTVLAPAGLWGLRATRAEGEDEPGVTLKEVWSGGAAAAAGLKVSDRLLTLDGRWTDSLADLYQAASQVKPGTPVQVVVRRGKKVLTFTVRPVSGL